MTETQPVPSEQVLAYLALERLSAEPFWERDVEDLRREMREECLVACGEPEPVASVEDIRAAGVPARLYRPVGGERDVLVWLHGGGWMIGDVGCYDALTRALANRVGCAVLSVDYRLAPEHRYPAAIDDCWAATEWAAARFDHVAIGGDSAGGNLSAAVALRARDRRLALVYQLLVYPALDYRPDSPFYCEFRDRYVEFAGVRGFGAQRQEILRRLWAVYVPDPARREEPYAAPGQALSLAGIAPALIINAEHDILRGEGEEYARRLADNGVPVEVLHYEGQIHGFFHLLGAMEDARDAVRRSADVLTRAFGNGPSDQGAPQMIGRREE